MTRVSDVERETACELKCVHLLADAFEALSSSLQLQKMAAVCFDGNIDHPTVCHNVNFLSNMPRFAIQTPLHAHWDILV